VDRCQDTVLHQDTETRLRSSNSHLDHHRKHHHFLHLQQVSQRDHHLLWQGMVGLRVLVLKVIMALPALKVLKAQLVLKVLKATALQDPTVLKVLKVTKVLKAQLVLLAQ